MCYQAFVHFACEHTGFFEQLCQQADGVPFWMPHACSSYSFESKYPNFYCGRGKYYCSALVPDGAMLDGLHATFDRNKAERAHIDKELDLVKQKILQFTQAADQRKVSHAVRPQHPAYRTLANKWTTHNNELARVNADIQTSTHIIKHAFNHFRQIHERRLQNPSTDFYIQPALTLPAGAGSIPMECEAFTNLSRPFEFSIAASSMAMTQQAINVSQGSQTPGHAFTQLPPSDGSNIEVTHVPRYAGYPGVGATSAIPTTLPQTALRTPEAQIRSSPGFKTAGAKIEMNWDPSIGKSRRRRPAVRREKPELPKKDSSSRRRSERVRDKKISYAESQASDASHGSSPDKYEIEGSPEKSDFSESPEPAFRRGRKQQPKPQGRVIGDTRIETLAGKIGGWKRRTANTGDDPTGKSMAARNEGLGGEQTAAQQMARTSFGKDQTSSKLWRAPSSQHSQVMLKGADPLTVGSQGMFGFRSSNPLAQPNALGRPFPDNSDIPAISTPNIFQTYLQSSVGSAAVPRAPSQSWSVQQGGQSSSPHHDLGKLYSGSGGETAVPAANPLFMPNPHGNSADHAGYPPASGPKTPADSRADSVIFTGDAAKLPDIDVKTYFDYNRMRHSFGTSHDLSPAKSPGDGVNSFEPRKRPLPASSPTPSAKRVRLTLPGQAGNSSAFEAFVQHDGDEDASEGTVAVNSSPANMTTHKTQAVGDDDMFDLNVPAPTSAPIIAPTAIHFPKALSPTLAENLESAAELPSLVGNGVEFGLDGGDDGTVGLAAEGGTVSAEGLDATLGREIDWGMMNEWSSFGDE